MESVKMFINGKWVESGQIIESINPATEEILGQACCADAGIVASAVEAARQALGFWRELSLWERAKYLRRIADAILDNEDYLKKLITQEMGRPLAESEIEVYETADMVNFFAEEGKAFLAGETLPINSAIFPNKFSFTVREPVGVVGIIKPWNYPLELPMWSIAPALLAGNTVVFKPSELTPLVGAAIGRIAEEVELPPGVLNVVFGAGDVGELLTNSGVDMIAFTGSVDTGKHIMRNSSYHLHKLSLELGGSDPFIVLPSADLEEAVNAAVWGRFTNCGQVCVSAKRIIVLKEIAKPFTEAFVEKTLQLRVGNGLDPETDVGPLVSNEQRSMLMEQIEDAVGKGAIIKCGGKIPSAFEKGFFYEPTILTDVKPGMKVLCEEVFGPAASILVVETIDEAARLANDSHFGLGASVWTTDLDAAFYLMHKLKSGMVWINEINVAYPTCPWGGIGNSGFGKELGREGVLEYTNVKHINIDFGKAKTREWWFPYKQVNSEKESAEE